ncbi:hypothetical protein KKD37_01305 [Patescibacteria group bacterium]|nr:hypothetical protein [Patescibacteria group bacterium]
MSYDLFLYRKDGILEPLNKDDVEKKLYPEFSVFEFNSDKGKYATYFQVYFSQGAQWSGFDFTFQSEDGCYWASCPYSVDREELGYFKSVVRDVAILLDFKINDPQISKELFEAGDYDPNDVRGVKAIDLVKEDMKPENMSKILGKRVRLTYPIMENSLIRKEGLAGLLSSPEKGKHFVFYVIFSRKPITLEDFYLTLDDGRFYASKVEKGESLEEVIKRDMKKLVGSEIYKLVEIDKNYDFALDKRGNKTPRTRLTLKVNFFEIDKVKSKYPMKWKKMETT